MKGEDEKMQRLASVQVNASNRNMFLDLERHLLRELTVEERRALELNGWSEQVR